MAGAGVRDICSMGRGGIVTSPPPRPLVFPWRAYLPTLVFVQLPLLPSFVIVEEPTHQR